MSADKAERRRVQRRPVLDSFSMFVVVPKKGVHRLKVHDISNLGVGFDLDIEGEAFEDFPVKKAEQFELHLYLNQSLYLPLKVEVVRVENAGMVRRIGAEFVDREGNGYKALQAFVQMIDAVVLAGRIGS
jgi:hypothetical protein